MNLNTISEVKRPTSSDEIPEWREGYAWLAGGTWISLPQRELNPIGYDAGRPQNRHES